MQIKISHEKKKVRRFILKLKLFFIKLFQFSQTYYYIFKNYFPPLLSKIILAYKKQYTMSLLKENKKTKYYNAIFDKLRINKKNQNYYKKIKIKIKKFVKLFAYFIKISIASMISLIA